MIGSLWQEEWFWGRDSVHDRWAKWCVILKVLAAFFFIVPREFLNVIIEFQKCRPPKIFVIANVINLAGTLNELRREEARDTSCFKGMWVDGLVELAILGVRAVTWFERDEFCRIRCQVCSMLLHVPDRVMAVLNIIGSHTQS